jgi:hypothetical protein
MFARRLRFRWLDKPMAEAPQAFFADWPFVHRQCPNHFPQRQSIALGPFAADDASSSEIDLQSGLANIADSPDESKMPRLRRC